MLQTHFYIHLNIAEKYFYSPFYWRHIPWHTNNFQNTLTKPWGSNRFLEGTAKQNNKYKLCSHIYKEKTDFPDFVGNAARNETILGTQSLGTHILGLLSAPPFQNECKPQTGTNTHTGTTDTDKLTKITLHNHCKHRTHTTHTHILKEKRFNRFIKLLQVINF